MSRNLMIPDEAFRDDGSLRDIYVSGTSEHDWQTFLDFLQTSLYSLNFSVANEHRLIPDRVTEIFRWQQEGDLTVTLYIDKSYLDLRCYFFTLEEIELSFKPYVKEREQKIARLLDFLRVVGQLLNKTIILTPENSEKTPFFRFNPEIGSEEWFDYETNVVTEKNGEKHWFSINPETGLEEWFDYKPE